jgi:hypothetical protein
MSSTRTLVRLGLLFLTLQGTLFFTPLHAVSLMDRIKNFFNPCPATKHSVHIPTSPNPHIVFRGKGPVTFKAGAAHEMHITSSVQSKEAAPPQPFTISQLTADNSIAITARDMSANAPSVTYEIVVPRGASLDIITTEGPIIIKEVEGSIKAETLHGKIEVFDACGTCSLKAPEGSVKLHQKFFSHDRGSIFIEAHGKIVLALPPRSTRANLIARTRYKTITSLEIPVCLDPLTTLLGPDFWQFVRQDVRGKIGGGGATIMLESYKGPVEIVEY